MADPYRDETESLRGRIATLEEELAGAHERIARLEGRGPQGSGIGPRLLGAPLAIDVRGKSSHKLEKEDQERILEVLRTRIGGAWHPANVDGSFYATFYDARQQRNIELSVRSVEGGSEIRFQERLGALAGGLFGGIVGGAGGGGLGLIIPLTIMFGLGAWTGLASVAWVALVYAIVRLGYRAAVAGRRRVLQLCVDDIIESSATRTRIADASQPSVATDASRDAEAEREAEAEADANRIYGTRQTRT